MEDYINCKENVRGSPRHLNTSKLFVVAVHCTHINTCFSVVAIVDYLLAHHAAMASIGNI